MDGRELSMRLAEGYVRQYRTLCLHTRSTWDDVTQREINLFAGAGEALGFHARVEVRRMDLSWHEPETGKIVLHLERETDRARVLPEALRKVLDSDESRDADHLVGILGWSLKQTCRPSEPELSSP